MIFLGIGTNKGNKGENLAKALNRLALKGIEVLRSSSVYETPPWGITEQDAFLNLVLEVAFGDSPEKLLEYCLETETEMGRKRQVKWGPRLIDIDILEFDRKVHISPSLSLPHPYYPQRDFVLVPLAELVPDWRPSLSLRSIEAILAERDTQAVKRVGEMRVVDGRWSFKGATP